MNNSEYTKSIQQYDSRMVGRWFDEMQLNVAPTCNMLCNFCSKGNDCICNGNDPSYWSKVMTPRQAANWAVSTTAKDKRVKVIKIVGPGEPLCNSQTFEVLKRLNDSLSNCVFSIATNGLLLEEKLDELLKLNVKMVDISINAVNEKSIKRLYSKLITNGNIVANPVEVTEVLKARQLNGMRKCAEYGIQIKINTVYFPGINDDDILEIAMLGKKCGVKSMCLISCFPGGKMTKIEMPSFDSMISLQRQVSRILSDVSIKAFN
jgi:Predicted Fe-S oxidoreductases